MINIKVNYKRMYDYDLTFDILDCKSGKLVGLTLWNVLKERSVPELKLIAKHVKIS